MELTIHGHGMEVKTRLHNYVEKKTAKLDRYMPGLTNVRVDLSEQKTRSAVDRYVAQITTRDQWGTILRAEERSGDVFASLDVAMDKLHRQIQRYRGKRLKRWHGRGRVSDEAMNFDPLPIDDADDEEAGTIVRRKRFSLQPMSSEEAIEQMELLGHDFFVYFDAGDEAINVVYRRRDGDFGLLQPEFD